MGCLDKVIEIYLKKADSKLQKLTSTTAWCLACFLAHHSLDEEHMIKIIPALKVILEKENDSETLGYLSFILIELITHGSRKIAEELENHQVYKVLQEGFSKHKQHSLQDPYLRFYVKTFEVLIEDKDTLDITLKHVTHEDALDNLFRYYFEVGLKGALLPRLMEISGEPIRKFHDFPDSYRKLYTKLEGDHSQTSPYLKILRDLIMKGSKEVLESLVHVEHNHDSGFFQIIIRSIPTRAVDYDALHRLLKAFNEIVSIAKTHKADANVIERIKAALLEHRQLVKHFLDKQTDEELQAEIKKLYEHLSIHTHEKAEHHKPEAKKVKVKVDSKLAENLPLKDEEIPNSLHRKFKRMSTMAQTAAEGAEFLQNANLNLRKTRSQTKAATESAAKKGKAEKKTAKAEDKKTKKVKKETETKETKKKGTPSKAETPSKATPKKVKKETKISKALPDHPAIRRTKTIEETMEAAKAFLQSHKKGMSVRKSLRSATKAAKKLRRTKTIQDTIESSRDITKQYGKGKRVKHDVDYSKLFFKKVRK